MISNIVKLLEENALSILLTTPRTLPGASCKRIVSLGVCEGKKTVSVAVCLALALQ